MPDREEAHLPYFEKNQVYEEFLNEYTKLQSGSKAPSRSYFYTTRVKHCSQVKVCKLHSFTECGDCERLRGALERNCRSLSRKCVEGR